MRRIIVAANGKGAKASCLPKLALKSERSRDRKNRRRCALVTPKKIRANPIDDAMDHGVWTFVRGNDTSKSPARTSTTARRWSSPATARRALFFASRTGSKRFSAT